MWITSIGTHGPVGVFQNAGVPVVLIWFRFNWSLAQWVQPGEGTHPMKVTTYAPPFRPPFSSLWKICIVSTPIFEQKMRKISTPIFCQNLTKYIVSTPSFWPFVAFQVYPKPGKVFVSSSDRPLPEPMYVIHWHIYMLQYLNTLISSCSSKE